MILKDGWKCTLRSHRPSRLGLTLSFRLLPRRMRRRGQLPGRQGIRVYNAAVMYASRRLGDPSLPILQLDLHAPKVLLDAGAGNCHLRWWSRTARCVR